MNYELLTDDRPLRAVIVSVAPKPEETCCEAVLAFRDPDEFNAYSAGFRRASTLCGGGNCALYTLEDLDEVEEFDGGDAVARIIREKIGGGAVVHIAQRPFVALCGADALTQATSADLDGVTCLSCLRLKILALKGD